ncbi:hypothetical protein GOV11_04955 [Candidatus Woesearchaeota archaeon]|nr:hypothetical protein [Candidatus Woesearchaeota archaeon]
MAKKTTGNGLAIVAYITLIGWIIALLLNMDKKNPLVRYHLRQSLLLMIMWMVTWFVPKIGWLLGLFVFVLWILGLINAINGVKKPVPLVGEYAEKWFQAI